ncbi:uncharacterized protein B0H18DRAFT_1125362 [Fomitopsis serialis]|uniref:uncharacterized protein n=1 Tax=Fomitopsis serialis TaxID=139415 RepID=UPI0020085C35|nr:uncharacterized protein B0H18DRAFT_1125362 [Neoantrodia serialis]KAH9914706.1 hypothetical protein B0H18DRAFT_1125362 [Neoantrodia serialis]
MGANQSTPQTDEKVFPAETPIQFSQDVVNQLADHMAAPDPPPERQSSIDAQIRARIQSELARLRAEEEAEAGEGTGAVKSSAALMGDLEELRSKVDRFKARREVEGYAQVQQKGEAVVSCYKNSPSRALDCWRQVNEFKASVSELEEQYVHSLH